MASAPASASPAAPHSPEQRKSPRYEVSAWVDLTGGSEVYLRHRIINISTGGLCIQCDLPEDIGTEVELMVHFPDLSASIPARGQVVWVNRSQPTDMGLRFVGLDDKRQETLKQYLQRAHQAQVAAA
jgi:uncharacterized protein (TIGR02266 family)